MTQDIESWNDLKRNYKSVLPKHSATQELITLHILIWRKGILANLTFTCLASNTAQSQYHPHQSFHVARR